MPSPIWPFSRAMTPARRWTWTPAKSHVLAVVPAVPCRCSAYQADSTSERRQPGGYRLAGRDVAASVRWLAVPLEAGGAERVVLTRAPGGSGRSRDAAVEAA